MLRGTCFSLMVLAFSTASGGPLWMHHTPGDPALCLLSLPDVTADRLPEIVAGYDSGKLVCFASGPNKTPSMFWQTDLGASVLALRVMRDADGTGSPEIVATTALGKVARVSAGGPSAGRVGWSFEAAFNISSVTTVRDIDSDGVDEVAFGGADHRVTLLSGRNGRPIWSRAFEAGTEITYVDGIVSAGDLNRDGLEDLLVQTWGAKRWAVSGRDGSNLWPPRPVDPFVTTLKEARDANGDEILDFNSGNDGVLMLCSGRDGSEIWRSPLGRPVRATEVTEDATGDGVFDCFAATAEGKVACISGAGKGTVPPVWTADLGDVCRMIVTPGDCDGDNIPDVVAGAENGKVAAFSGDSGRCLWQWQGSDVIRAVTTAGDHNGDGVPEVVVSVLDGTLALLSGKEPGTPLAAAEPEFHITRPVRKRVQPATTDVAQVPILLYHDVSPKGLRPSDASPLGYFREHMDYLAGSGYNPVSLDDVADWIEGKANLPPKPVCITFDGQYASHYPQLFRILKERGLFGTSYITTDWIGTANHLDWHQLRLLEQSGVMEIENHSYNHPTPTTVGKEEYRRQLTISNEAIRRHLGKLSKHHAYPNGPYDAKTLDVMREEGFRTATSVRDRRALRTDGVYQLPRFTIAENMPLASLKAVMGDGGAACAPLPHRYDGLAGIGWRQPGYGDIDADGVRTGPALEDVGRGRVRPMRTAALVPVIFRFDFYR